jgi:cell wall-associated NlpC family hydrolase
MELKKDTIVFQLANYVADLENQNDTLSINLQNSQTAVIDLQTQLKTKIDDNASLQNQVNQLTTNPTPTDAQIKAQRVIGVMMAFDFLNVPYKFGAEWENDKAFDCSSFVQKCFLLGAGLKLPRTCTPQSALGTTVKFEDMIPGDMIFYDFNHDGNISHVATYIGGNQILHTNTPATGINYQPSTWNKAGIAVIKRVL